MRAAEVEQSATRLRVVDFVSVSVLQPRAKHLTRFSSLASHPSSLNQQFFPPYCTSVRRTSIARERSRRSCASDALTAGLVRAPRLRALAPSPTAENAPLPEPDAPILFIPHSRAFAVILFPPLTVPSVHFPAGVSRSVRSPLHSLPCPVLRSPFSFAFLALADRIQCCLVYV